MSTARFDAFARGEIVGMRRAGASREEIRKAITKKDGSTPSLRAVAGVLAKQAEEPEWRGEDSAAGGRPRHLTPAQEKVVERLVFKERGQAKVTVPYCRKRLPFLRDVSKDTARRTLYRAGLAWLRRRKKAAVPKKWRQKRVAHCRWLLAQPRRVLRRFAYTDGTTFYLARGLVEHENKKRAALGPSVWRMASGKDGLWHDNVGPSLYAKSQGLPMKIWGFFADGCLQYYVLPADGARKTTNMNGDRYNWLVGHKFEEWRRACFGDNQRVSLVQDHERCLWRDDNLAALTAAGCDVVKGHPKYSPDLNAIEGWWARLRTRLEETAPVDFEGRAAFLQRLRRTVTWMNTHWRLDGRELCTNQKERATEIRELHGAKCHF